MLAILSIAATAFLVAPALDDCSNGVCKARSKTLSLVQTRLALARTLEHHSAADVDCLLLEAHMSVEDSEIRKWECQFEGGIVEIRGLTRAWLAQHSDEMISGTTKLKITRAVIDGKVVTVTKDSGLVLEPEDGHGNARRPALLQDSVEHAGANPNIPLQAERTFLAVRAVGTDGQPSLNAAQISDGLFGTAGDQVHVMERFEKCSHGSFNVKPYIGTTSTGVAITNGVYEIELGILVDGEDQAVVKNFAVNALQAALGPLKEQFGHVLLVMPSNVQSGWIAYAYANHWLSVYFGTWVVSPSAGVHEVGHNLGLGHAGEDGDEYADQSGLMGYSYSNTDGPIMCFNGVKNWQLAWFPGAYALANPREMTWTGGLVGMTDYDLRGENVVVTKVETGEDMDYYVSFNRATGINSGTIEGRDQVLVHSTGLNGSSYSRSMLLAKLSAGGTFAIPSLATIRVTKIDLTLVPAVAEVTIEKTPAPTPATTPAPTPAPTPTPTLPALSFCLAGRSGQERVTVAVNGASETVTLPKTPECKTFLKTWPICGEFQITFLNDASPNDVYFSPAEEFDITAAPHLNDVWACGSGTENTRCTSVREGNFLWDGVYNLKPTTEPASIPTRDATCMSFCLEGRSGQERVTVIVNGAAETATLPKIQCKDFRKPWPSSGEFQITFLNDDSKNDVYFQPAEAFEISLPEKADGWACSSAEENWRCDYVRQGTFAWNGTYTLKVPAPSS